MRAARWQEARDLIADLAGAPRLGMFSDLDGTLSPIAATPEAAQITPRNRALLAELAEETPLVAIISGRSAASLKERVGLPGLVYVGNHGLDRWTENGLQVIPEAEPYLGGLQTVKAELQEILEPGAFIEDKGATLSLHYRQAAQPLAFARDKAASIAQIVERRGLTLFTGKMVFEVRPPVEMDKGIAFRELVKEYGIEAAIFLGDDVSDLNALQMARRLRAEGSFAAWGVGIQSEDTPEGLAEAADFLAAGVADVEELLAWVLKARRASST